MRTRDLANKEANVEQILERELVNKNDSCTSELIDNSTPQWPLNWNFQSATLAIGVINTRRYCRNESDLIDV